MEQRDLVLDNLRQIEMGIENLQQWNEGISDMNMLLRSPGGMQDLAGNCMLIMAVTEGFKKIDKMTDGKLLPQRPEIPWRQVFGLRNRIAHGYFDIDTDIISEIVNNDLEPLLEVTRYFIRSIENNEY